MPRISRSSLLISIAIMIAVVAAACDSPASKPTAEPDPPTPIPTVTTETESTTEDSAASTNTGGRGFADPEVRACLTEEMGEDALDNLGQGSGVGLAEEWIAAFEKCGLGSGDGATLFGGRGGGGRLGGGFAGGGAFANPEVQECLTAELGEDFGSGGSAIFGGFTGGGLSEELTAAFEECGIDLAGGFGGRLGGGGFGGGNEGGRGGFGGLVGDGSFQECLTEALGEDALLQLRNPDGPPSVEVQEALQECGNVVAIPVESGSGDSDGDDLVTEEPTATPIPVSDLTIEQLTCLSGELEPGDLAGAVVATSSGDLSKVSGTVLAALQTCGVVS